MYNSTTKPRIADLLAQPSEKSSDIERFYNTVKEYTDKNYGFISGVINIIDLFNGDFDTEQIKKFCKSLSNTKHNFRYEERSYQGVSAVQNIWIDIV